MEWSGKAILLSLRRHGEHAAIAKFFTETQGLCAALAHGAYSSKQRGNYQTGNILNLSLRSRTTEQLSSVRSADLQRAVPAQIMHSGAKLQALSAACALTESSLAEHHPEPQLFSALLSWLEALADDAQWLENYIRFEVLLLASCGYGLNLNHCAVTGTSVGLAYVSPKSGRAVTRVGAGPYRDMLLPLPAFICNSNAPAEEGDNAEGMQLTGHFLNQWIYAPRGKSLPSVRRRLAKIVQTPARESPLHLPA